MLIRPSGLNLDEFQIFFRILPMAARLQIEQKSFKFQILNFDFLQRHSSILHDFMLRDMALSYDHNEFIID